MRLLNTTTLELHEFFGSNIPYYAILSHRWGADEVTFQDLQQGRGSKKAAGWAKITGCCGQAKREGWEYAWIDSCCIDKSSSAELSEAINSMFQWYKHSQVCYAYLNDVPIEEDHERESSAFWKSAWFTRGWTLQELLAPDSVVFFNSGWVEIGTRCTFGDQIASITGIHSRFLEGAFSVATTAQKFSWASQRKTLRIEDEAYCLMGLFGVNMPLLYGEGRRAFLRLQLEIMKISDDESLFAWTDSPSHASLGPLAVTPVAFRHAGNVVRIGEKAAAPYSMTNKGISISLALMSRTEASEAGVQVENYPNVPDDDDDDGVSQIFAPLNCGISRSPRSEQLQILLYLLQGTFDTGDRWYMRPNVSQLATLPLPALQIRPERKQILIFFSQNNLSVTTPTPPGSHFTIQAKLLFHMGYAALAVSKTSVENTSNKVGDISIYQRRRIEVDPEGVFIYDASFRSESRDFVEFQGPRGPDGVFEAFILQIDYTLYRWGQTGITLLLPSSSSTDELDRLISAAKTRPCSPCDRASITLPSGCQVYAAFRKWIRAGELAYRIDLNVGVPKGGPKGEKDAHNGAREVAQDRARQQILARRMVLNPFKKKP